MFLPGILTRTCTLCGNHLVMWPSSQLDTKQEESHLWLCLWNLVPCVAHRRVCWIESVKQQSWPAECQPIRDGGILEQEVFTAVYDLPDFPSWAQLQQEYISSTVSSLLVTMWFLEDIFYSGSGYHSQNQTDMSQAREVPYILYVSLSLPVPLLVLQRKSNETPVSRPPTS